MEPTNQNLKSKHYRVQERATLGFYTGEGFTAPLYNPKASGAGGDSENWLNFGAGLLSFVTTQFPSLGRDSSALLGHLGNVRNCPTKLNKSTGDGNPSWELSKRNLHLNLWIPGITMFLDQPCHCNNSLIATF